MGNQQGLKAARSPLRLIDCRKQRREEQRREVAAVLRHLAEEVQQGNVDGLLLAVKKLDGTEDLVAAGTYRGDLASSVNAAMRLSLRMTQLQEEQE